ncbi:tRNA lysidine(34) synthetase TilS [Brevundimonas sp.]|uniref:tRNA lysidine(34) synthetase TilS n=1 Tax=Brevundimonas sp. TaxID=1871086 RepID=UPI0035B10430
MRLTDIAGDPLAAEVAARLDARLAGSDRPVALALSGGGDSMALLHLTAGWARARGRRIVAFTVDHGLHSQSSAWTAFAGEAACFLGLDWRALEWRGDKPRTNISAKARHARHALLAGAAREAGATVLMMAHTADDIAEADWMRARGSTLGRLSEWSPAPVWPEGRDVMLLRPLLGIRRERLRGWLRDRRLRWIDDPANVDPASARARARRDLAGRGEAKAAPAPSGPRSLASETEAFAGIVRLPRQVGGADLAAAAVSVGGGEKTPRGDRLAGILSQLGAGSGVVATLAGARIEATSEGLILSRVAGRGGIATATLLAGDRVVWDGRYELLADRSDLSVTPLAGKAAHLSAQDRAWVRTLPSAARPTLPVLIGDGLERPVLAGRLARVRCLVPGRYTRAVGGTSQASDLEAPAIGEMAPDSLSR